MMRLWKRRQRPQPRPRRFTVCSVTYPPGEYSEMGNGIRVRAKRRRFVDFATLDRARSHAEWLAKRGQRCFIAEIIEEVRPDAQTLTIEESFAIDVASGTETEAIKFDRGDNEDA